MNEEYILSADGNTQFVSEPQQSWGGDWTEVKLDAFEKYVKAYLTIMKQYKSKSGWKLIYFDGFAGSGSRETVIEEVNDVEETLFADEEIMEFVEQTSYKGAAERVLGIDIDGFSFDYYYFVDKGKKSL